MRAKFILDRKTFCARASMVCMLLAIIFRVIGTVGHFSDQHFLIFRLGLPALSCLLFIITILLFGKKGFWMSFIPVIVGIVFFFLRILSDDNITQGNLENIHIVICIVFYLLIAVIYSCTVFGAIKTKFFLIVIFGLAFAYHVVFEDYPAIAAKSVAAEAIFMELGVLAIILGMFFVSLGLKKQTTATVEKSKDVIPPVPGGMRVHSDPEPKTEPVKEAIEETSAPAPEEKLEEAVEEAREAVEEIVEEAHKETEE